MRRRGFFVIARQATDGFDRYWKEKPFGRWRARLDLFMKAAFSNYQDADGVELTRGELRASYSFLAGRWGWTRRQCERFMEREIAEGSLERVPRGEIKARGCEYSPHKDGTVWRIVNYDEYQPPWLGMFLSMFERPDQLARVIAILEGDDAAGTPASAGHSRLGGRQAAVLGETGGETSGETQAIGGKGDTADEGKPPVKPPVNKRSSEKESSANSLEGPKKKTRRRAVAKMPPIPEILDTPNFRLEWERKLRERREKRRTVSPSQAESLLGDLADMARMRGIDYVVKRVHDSVSGGWSKMVFADDFKVDERQGDLFSPAPGGDRDDRGQGGEL